MPTIAIMDLVPPHAEAARTPTPGRESTASPLAVLLLFLRLGCMSFGGPFAHIAFIRSAVVVRSRWLSESAFADTLSLAQLLPGPSSSQLGVLIGYQRAGWWGALAAWIGFTMPSAVLMIGAACALGRIDPGALSSVMHGIAIAALVIVADAVWGMADRLCTDACRRLIACASAVAILLLPFALAQVLVIACSGILGALLVQVPAAEDRHAALRLPGIAISILLWAVVAALLVGLPLLSAHAGGLLLRLCADLVDAGALVFGGGHVVLPLIQVQLVNDGVVDNGHVLAAYGLAQVVPGPLFSLAAYLGASSPSSSLLETIANALCALCALFLPGILMALGSVRAPFMRSAATPPCSGPSLA
jgi:chromate transporter